MGIDCSKCGKPVKPLPVGFIHLGGGFCFRPGALKETWVFPVDRIYVEIHPFCPSVASLKPKGKK